VGPGVFQVDVVLNEPGRLVVRFDGDRGWSEQTYHVDPAAPSMVIARAAQPQPAERDPDLDADLETMVAELRASGVEVAPSRSGAFVRAAHAELERRNRARR